ncbi:MAG: thioesterase family protein [Ginsengibacter sp.]
MARIKIELPEKCISVFTIPVRITDINYGNHVGNNSLVEIIHEARMQFLQQYDFTEMDAGGSSLIMNELTVEFKNESLYKDILEVKIFVGEISRVSFELFYSISVLRNNSSTIIATAKTGMVCFDYNEKKVVTMQDKLKKILSVSISR